MSESKLSLLLTLGLFVFMGVGALLCYGPAGIKTGVSGWKASAYGSDWLVVQYAQSGCVITYWELENEAVQNESGSDGIYFVTEEGPVVHLSGHYAYVQNPEESVKTDLLATGKCSGQ